MNIDKKKILIIAAVIILIVLVLGFFYFLSSKKKEKERVGPKSRTLEEILREDLTALSGAEVKISQDLINKLSVPDKKKVPPVSEEIIESLTAPASK
jgi:flagellar basal body-associated protein FliL